MSDDKTPFWKRFGRKTIIAVAALLMAAGLLAVFSQPRLRDTLFGSHGWKVVGNFVDEATRMNPTSLIGSWFRPETGELPLTREEELTRYQLRLVARSLDNFFRLLLTDTQKLVDHEVFQSLLGDGRDPFQESHGRLKEHLQDNMEILEVSIWSKEGSRVASLRYKSANEYLISPKLLSRLDQRDNLLLRHSASPNLVLVSAIRHRGKVIGAVSQTLSPLFFTKILDFLGVGQNVFYLRNREGDLVLDNYGSSQHLTRREESPSYAFYRKFTEAKQASLTLKIEQVEYDLGVIVEKNNLAGHLLALAALLVCVYLALLLVQLLWKHSGRLLLAAWNASRKRTEEPALETAPAAVPSPDGRDALDLELARLRERDAAVEHPAAR